MSFKDFINEKEGDKEAYQKFFDKMLKKYGVESPEELSDEDKKKFYDEVDRGWKSDDEELEEAFVVGDIKSFLEKKRNMLNTEIARRGKEKDAKKMKEAMEHMQMAIDILEKIDFR